MIKAQESEYIRCTRCIMDNNSDETISFNEQGQCNYCESALNRLKQRYFPNEKGASYLAMATNNLKEKGVGKKYDCIIGVSGGLDSSYLVFWAATQDLRGLCVHIDDGYDTDIAKSNIKKLCGKAGFDLIALAPDAEQYNDLIRAYLLAGVPDLSVPQDNVLFSTLYRYAKKSGINNMLIGTNFALECILQKGNSFSPYDKSNILDIHKKFGTKPINKLEVMSQYEMFFCNRRLSKITVLDYLDYNKLRAMQELEDFCGFDYYGRKHHENKLTRFIQEYYMFRKFVVDKRTSHLSSMIVSGQLTRNEALKLMEEPLLDEIALGSDIEVILDNINLSREQFDEIMNEPPNQHTDYKTSNYERFYKLAYKLNKTLRKEK
jgi:N-acetyl sugar amidotransferase